MIIPTFLCQKWLFIATLLIVPGGEYHTARIKSSETKRRGNAAEEENRRRSIRARSSSVKYDHPCFDSTDGDSDGDVYLTSAQRANRKKAINRKESRQSSLGSLESGRVSALKLEELSIATASNGRISQNGETSDEDIKPSLGKKVDKNWNPHKEKSREQRTKDVANYPSAERMKKTRGKRRREEMEAYQTNEDSAEIHVKKGCNGESDTDEEKDDIRKPKKRSPFKLKLNTCPTCLAQMYEKDRICCQHGRVVKVQGAVHSFPSCALPLDENNPRFGNFYVYTGDEALEMRKKVYDNVDEELLAELQQVMDDHNTLGKYYRRLGEMIKKAEDDVNGPHYVRMKIIDACHVDSNTLQGHPGIYRTPGQKGDYIAVFYTASVEQYVTLPGLIIYPIRNRNKPMRPIFYHDPKISPLCYPLLFPYGEYGYQRHHFPLEKDRTKPFWVRFVEYYENKREELAQSEANVSFDEAMKLAKKSGYKKKGKKKLVRSRDDSSENSSDENISEDSDSSDSDQDDSSDESDIEDDEDAFQEFIQQELAASCPANSDDESTNDQTDDIRGNDSDGEPFYLKKARTQQENAEGGEVYDHDMTENQQDDHLDTPEQAGDPPEDRDAGSDQDLSGNEANDGVNTSDMGSPEKDDGGRKKIQNKGPRDWTTRKEYETYRAMERSFINNRYNWGGKLSQLYLIQAVTQIYQQRTSIWISKTMEFLNSTKSRFLNAFNRKAQRHGKLIGCLARIPAKFPGSPRWLQQHFLNAVTMSNQLGKCDLFITATCNVKWDEIQSRLKPGQSWEANPFLVNQVFNEKLKLLMEVIQGKKKSNGTREKGIFGRVRWSTYSIEFQQRGPPHAHIIISLKRKIKTIEQIEKVCQANLPADPDMRSLVESFMIHRPCEGINTAYCRAELKNKNQKQCKKNFPKDFSDTTKAGDRNYPELKRPNDGEVSSRNPDADNRYVVPYNTELLSLWGGHLNVEVISTLRVVKYIFKYLFKGFDRVLVESVNNLESMDMAQMTVDGHLIYPKNMNIPSGVLEQRQKEAEQLLKSHGIPTKNPNNPKEKVLVYNEYSQQQDLRAMTSCEAAWELAAYPRFGCSHVIFWQTVHEEHEEPIFYKKGEEEEMAARIKNDEVPTHLKAWFQLNQEDQDAHKYTFAQIGIFYTYKNGKWIKKKKIRKNALGAIATVNPKRRELFAIRLLALHRKGVTSFKDLRTVDGVVHKTFVQAAKDLGLMNDEKEWFDCIEEASSKDDPKQLRRLFALILTSNPVMQPRKLWEEFKENFYERRNWSTEMLQAHALNHIQSLLKAHGKDLGDYNLPGYKDEDLPPQDDRIDDSGHVPLSWYQRNAPQMRDGLTSDQRTIFDKIFSSIMDRKRQNAFFLQGSGGTGKTVLLKALFYNLLAKKKTVACVAHTGNAATLLPRGSTAHRLFHIPLATEDGMNVNITLESPEADSLQKIDCIIWDEATMTDNRIYEAVHKFFSHLHHEDPRIFGGVHFIMTGDWKQTLPIVEGIRGEEVIKYTLLEWKRWKHVQVLQLTKNMRAAEDEEFAAYLEYVGKGIGNVLTTSRRPEDQLFNMKKLSEKKCFVPSELDVIKKVFGKKGTPEEKLKDFEGAAILTVDNKSMNEFNEVCLKELLTGSARILKSIDEYDPKTGFQALDPESYHNATPSGMPPHALKLKIGAIVILLRNMNTDMGLTNGTRMVVEAIGNKLIFCRPLTRKKNTPQLVGLPRVVFAPANALSREVAFKRLQFPVKLAFCMTCNKAQGQTLKSFKDLCVFNANDNPLVTNNVVYKRVFDLLEKSIKRQTSGNVETSDESDNCGDIADFDPVNHYDTEQRIPPAEQFYIDVDDYEQRIIPPTRGSGALGNECGKRSVKRTSGKAMTRMDSSSPEEQFYIDVDDYEQRIVQPDARDMTRIESSGKTNLWKTGSRHGTLAENEGNQSKKDKRSRQKVIRCGTAGNIRESPASQELLDFDFDDEQPIQPNPRIPTRTEGIERRNRDRNSTRRRGKTTMRTWKKRVEDSDESERSSVRMGRFQRKSRNSQKRKNIPNGLDRPLKGREPPRKAVKVTSELVIQRPAELGFEQNNCLILKNPSVFCFANVVTQTCWRVWKDRILNYAGGNVILTELRSIILEKGAKTVKGLLDKMPGFSETVRTNDGMEYRSIKMFNDGNQHDAEELWTALLNEIDVDFSDEFNVQQGYQHVCQEVKTNGRMCCNTTPTPLGKPEKFIEIHAKLRKGAGLEEYLANLLEIEKDLIRKECNKCPGQMLDKKHTRRSVISIPPTTRFLTIRISLRNSILPGREFFINRGMANIQDEVNAFDHKWKPVVLIRHQGCEDQSTGEHYIAYLKNGQGWLEIDDKIGAKQLPAPPPMRNISIVILKKMGRLQRTKNFLKSLL